MVKQAKQVDYGQLYYNKEIQVVHPSIANGCRIECSIEINDLNRVPDCKIGHFGYNFWFRTNAGLKKRMYKNCDNLERAVKKLMVRKGFEVIGYV